MPTDFDPLGPDLALAEALAADDDGALLARLRELLDKQCAELRGLMTAGMPPDRFGVSSDLLVACAGAAEILNAYWARRHGPAAG